MNKVLIVVGVILVSYGAYGFGKRAGIQEGYTKGYKEALQVGACYGARSIINQLGGDIQCPEIPPELMPQQPED